MPDVWGIAWDWGITVCTVRRIFLKVTYGSSFRSQKGRAAVDKIMDVLANHEAVVKIVEDAKGRTSARKLAKAFKFMTGIAVSRKVLVKHLKSIGLQIARRRYAPMLTEVHKLTRYTFGTRYQHDQFENWVDLDEKWYVLHKSVSFVVASNSVVFRAGSMSSGSKDMSGFCRAWMHRR